MSKLKIILFFIALVPAGMLAQKVELTPFAGYVFGGNIDASNGGYVHINDNAQYGGMLSIAVNPAVDLDLIYNRSDTKAEFHGVSYYYGEVPLSINYMQIGGTKNFRVNPTISPFVGFNLGACLMYPKEDYSDAWFFSVGMNAGAKVYFSKRIGLRIQAQGYIPIQASGYTFYVGTGGSGSGVSFYSTLFQFGFTGGLIFRLGN
jgi:hypothetical protein